MHIDEMIFPELKMLHQQLRDLESGLSDAEKEQRRSIFVEVAKKIYAMCKTAKHDGLLALPECEEYFEDPRDRAVVHHLSSLIMDGTEPELLERNAMLEYFAMEHDAYQGIVHLMLIYGMQCLQQGEGPAMIADTLQSMVPYGVELGLRERKVELATDCSGNGMLSPSEISKLLIGSVSAGKES